MAPKKFSYEAERIIIEFFQCHRFFWDISDSNHKLAKRSAAAEELAHVVFKDEFSIDQLFEKFSSLRSTFRDNHRKATLRKSGSGADEVFIPTWWHYKRMLFLADTYKPRQSVETPINPVASMPIEDEGAIYIFDDEGNLVLQDHSTQLTTSPAPSKSNSSTIPKPTTTDAIARKRKKDMDEDSELLELAKKAITESSRNAEHNAWANHAAIRLEKMSPYNAAVAKIEMDQILLKYHPDNPSL